MRPLVRDLVLEPAGDRLVGRDAAAPLERRVADAVLGELSRHDEIGAREHLVDRAPDARVVEHEVVAEVVEEGRRTGIERVVHADHGTQRLVVDHDEVAPVGRERGGLGDDERDRVADVAHLVARERADLRGLQTGRPGDHLRGHKGSSSVAVSTATTPGTAHAADTSTSRMRAWAWGLRTKARCSIPGRATAETNRSAPVRNRGSSTRSMLWPVKRGTPSS